MTNRFLNQSPLPFDTRGPNAFIPTQYPTADVVEPNSVGSARLHSHFVDDSSNQHEGFDDSDFVHHNNVGDEATGNNNNGRSPSQGRVAVEHGSEIDSDNISREDRLRADRAHILQRDKFDREVSRTRAERDRASRRDSGRTNGRPRRGRGAIKWPRSVAADNQRVNSSDADVCRSDNPLDHPGGGRRESELPTQHHRNGSWDVDRVATHSISIKRLVDGPLHGTALGIYFVLLPYVVITKWSFATRHHDAILVRGLLLLLAVLWSVFLLQFVRNLWRLRRGQRTSSGGSAWLASLVVALLPFIVHATTASPVVSSAPLHRVTSLSTQSVRDQLGHRPIHEKPGPRPVPSSSLGAIPLALMAKQRSDLLRQHQFTDSEDDVDATVALLRSLDPGLITSLRQLIGANAEGVLDVAPGTVARTTTVSSDPVVACSLGESSTGTLVSFAREGGCLAVVPDWTNDDIRHAVVSLHAGKLLFVDSLTDLLRSLATRTLHNTLVVYLGDSNELDDELSACSVTISPYCDGASSVATPAWKNVALARNEQPHAQDVRVDLLRADPQVIGLYEPLTPTLRRRCIEMLAYLALHRHEPITGDRLRTRVLAHADVDASIRTLANTASAVRRSLGADGQGSRLHQVTSSGLYVTHGVSSDVEIFTTLVHRARQLPTSDGAPLAHQALALIKGEPLASALRGFEWFLAEGFGARLSRDGEWAALVLHHDALSRDQYELAFWALQQGLLIDPYSDVLREASARVPRLREFGGDRPGRSQDESVGAHRTESMSWSLNGFSHEVTQ